MLLVSLVSATVTGVIAGFLGKKSVDSSSDYIERGISNVIVAGSFLLISRGQDSFFDTMGLLAYIGVIKQMIMSRRQHKIKEAK